MLQVFGHISTLSCTTTYWAANCNTITFFCTSTLVHFLRWLWALAAPATITFWRGLTCTTCSPPTYIFSTLCHKNLTQPSHFDRKVLCNKSLLCLLLFIINSFIQQLVRQSNLIRRLTGIIFQVYPQTSQDLMVEPQSVQTMYDYHVQTSHRSHSDNMSQ